MFHFEFSLISKYRTELMGIAILGVIIGHFMNLTWSTSTLAYLVRCIHTCGFIFLSGLGLFYSFSNDDDKVSFYKKRIKRLVLPFLIMSFPLFIIICVQENKTFFDFIGYITTAAYWYEGNYHGMWYIAISVMLYLLYPFIHNFIFKSNRNIYLKCVLSIIIYFVLICILKYRYSDYYKIISFGFEKAIIFPLGMLCGYLSKNNKECNLWCLILLTSLFVILNRLSRLDFDGIYCATRTLICLPFVTLLLFGINKKFGYTFKVFSFFGKYTLEIYIIHVLLSHILSAYCIGWVSMGTGIITSIIICKPIHIIIERIINKKCEA